MTNGLLIILMGFLFLFLGYMGVPVAFALIASVLIVTAFTPVSHASMMAQLFNGMDTEALLAVPFFLLVGDLMTSANVTVRMITLSQTMVGHLRGGLAQVAHQGERQRDHAPGDLGRCHEIANQQEERHREQRLHVHAVEQLRDHGGLADRCERGHHHDSGDQGEGDRHAHIAEEQEQEAHQKDERAVGGHSDILRSSAL